MSITDQPPLPGVFLAHAFSFKKWSAYTKADYTIEQWHKACLIHQHTGAPTSKDQCKLPVRTPLGALNKNGIQAAKAALNGARGGVDATPEEKAKAKAQLDTLSKELESKVPAFLAKHSDMDASKPPLDAVYLAHFGVRGMRWGHQKTDAPGVSRKTNKEASKDASEFARAKMFYGDGAGTRRKLIKATVDAKAKKDPNYQKAFDHHLGLQDMSTHAEKARSERGRKDTRASVGKTARGLNRAINGPFAATVTVTALVAGYGALSASGMDKKLVSAGKGFVNQVRHGTKVDLGFLK